MSVHHPCEDPNCDTIIAQNLHVLLFCLFRSLGVTHLQCVSYPSTQNEGEGKQMGKKSWEDVNIIYSSLLVSRMSTTGI